MCRRARHDDPLGAEPHLRASDADRERTADVLKRACAEGRLTPDELSDRLERAFRARTFGDLAVLTADLPGGAPARRRRPAPPARRSNWGLRIAGVVALAIVFGPLVHALSSVGVALAIGLGAAAFALAFAMAPIAALVFLTIWAVRRLLTPPPPRVHRFP